MLSSKGRKEREKKLASNGETIDIKNLLVLPQPVRFASAGIACFGIKDNTLIPPRTEEPWADPPKTLHSRLPGEQTLTSQE